MLIEVVLIYLTLGAVAGFMAGLLGVGGGLVIVPALAALFLWQGMDSAVVMHVALGTSLATIAVTAISSVRAHHLRGAVRWPWVWRLAPGLMLGAAVGAVIADQLQTQALAWVFGFFEIGIGLYMLLGAPRPAVSQEVIAPAAELGFVGTLIGAVSSLLGIGGGTLTVPYLAWRGVVMQQAVAVSAACGLPIALAGALSYIAAGWGAAGLPAATSGYFYWPAFVGIVCSSVLMAPVGARVAHALPVRVLKQVFALFLMVIGVAMLSFFKV